MAEILGTVASGISVAQLAGNLASSIIKLKSYWDQIRDAPDDIGFLVREIHTHHLILRSILESQAKIASTGRPSNTFLENSLKLCEDSSNELNELVKALGKEINSSNKWRSKLGATKVVLKNDQLKRLKKRMKNASRLMNLAITWQTKWVLPMLSLRDRELLICSSATLQQQFPVFELNIQASLDQFLMNHQKLIPAPQLSNPTTQISSMNTLAPRNNVATITQPQNFKCDNNSTSYSVPKDYTSTLVYNHVHSSSWSIYPMGSIDVRKTQQKRKRNRFEETEAKYKPPAWLSNRAWQCMYTKDLSTLRWCFNIQTYRTLGLESDFYQALKNGDVVAVQEILANRTAFLNDRFVGGPGTASWDQGTPLHIAASNNHLGLCKLLLAKGADISSVEAPFGCSWAQALDRTQTLNILRTLIEAGADSELINQTDVLAKSAGGPIEIFQYLQQYTFTSSGETNFIKKILIAHGFIKYRGAQAPGLILSFLGSSDFQKNIALHCDDSALKIFFLKVCRRCSRGDSTDSWVDLVKKMISAGMSLHVLTEYGTVLQYICWKIWKNFLEKENPYTLEKWLGILVKLGIDLNAYGERESSLFKKKMTFFDGRTMAQYSYIPVNWRLKYILGFTYGPRIEDWELWFLEWTDEYAGDFWKLIENPIQATLANLSIPGGWVD
ncbi:hypothetical protein BCON_0007g00970 [Botryotinia convoluta]|uniref:Uncharacterized protein n=1 Tax=Botryotinia convoluta TaxID=54673 RepID=A0A4Z1J6F6_9HELO|nr:hypothetical protein BCON_0007g00970 [Botryotinia convoluta]